MLFFLLGITANLQAQDRTVSGTVTSEEEGALPGVNILVKGTTLGTVTDVEGSYRINVGSDDAVLVFSAVGYTTEEVPVNSQSTIDMLMLPDIKSLTEVVVVGYGNQERAKVSSAISSISGEEISELPVTSVDQALQGKVAGVNVIGSGQPGRNPTIRIRGLGSTRNADPLFVVDGIPIGQGGLNDIHPDNIESMSILKDAASTAIYGSRGANGVVLITTKRGAKGPAKFSLDAYYGSQNLPKKLDLLNTQQYVDFARDYTAPNPPPRLRDLGEFAGNDTDWQEAALPGGPIQDYYLRVSGGNDDFVYNVGGGFFDQDGLVVNTYFKRASFNINTEVNRGRLKVGQSLLLARTATNFENGGTITRAVQMMPYIPVRDPSRKGGFRGPDGAEGADPFQPVLFNELIDDEQITAKIFGTVFAEYEIIEGLKYRFQGGVDYAIVNEQNFTPTFDAGEVQFNVNVFPTLRKRNTVFLSPVLTNTLGYDRTFGKHSVGAVVGYERQTNTFERFEARTDSLNNENVQDINNSLPSKQFGDSDLNKTGIVSYFGRLNYDYEGKYIVMFSVRRDQASVFGPENNVGVFPAVSAAWRPIDEPFLDGLKGVFSDLKIRGSWGINGNTSIGAYSWDPTTISNLNYNFNGQIVSGLSVSRLFNQQIGWEEVEKINVGLDAELLNGKLGITIEYFNNTVKDLVIEVPVAASSGLDQGPLANIGDVVNRGAELVVGYANRDGAFKWSLDGNISYVNNEVQSLGFNETSTIAGPTFQNTGDPQTFAEAGEPIGYFFGYKVDRIYQNQGEIDADNNLAVELSGDANAKYQANASPGDIRFQDLNNDGTIGSDDRTNIGHYLAPITYGLTGSGSFQGFDFSFTFQGNQGNEVLNSLRYYREGATRLFNMGTEILDAWTPTNTDTNVPRAVSSDPNNNARLSDRFIEDGSYLRMRFLTVGYSLPPGLLESISNGALSKVRFYFTGQNLLTFTNYSGYDPEVQGNGNASEALFRNGIDNGTPPVPRTLIGGLQIVF